MQYESGKINVRNQEGVDIECDIISQFRNEDTGKDYLVYTDNSRNEMGRKNMFVVSYRPDLADDNQNALTPVETEEEWISISGFLEELRKLIEEKGLDL